MLCKKNLVKTWLNTPYDSPHEKTCLQVAFEFGTATSTENEYFFDDVYIPVKIPTASGMPDDFTYEKIGFSTEEIAEIYGMNYLGNYLIDPCIQVNGTYSPSAKDALGRRIKAVFKLNKQKYLKLIELQGYKYNPLWNVDGTEEYTYLENQGVNDVKNAAKIGTVTGKTNTYDGELRNATQTLYGTVGNANNNQESETTYTHKNAKNLNEYGVETDYTATSAFGEDIKGGDKFHTEKRIRTGNIGVTKTQELIASERENLRFTVLQEFFDDINKQILIGIFDN